MRHVWGLVLAALLIPTVAKAAEPEAESDALVLRALELRRNGDDRGALPLLVRADTLARTPRTLAQRALAEQAVGDFVAAELHLQSALAHTEDRWIQKHREDLEEALKTVSSHLGTLTLRVDARATVTVDGGPLASELLGNLRLVRGEHTIEARLGERIIRRTVTLGDTPQTEVIDVLPHPAPAAGVAAAPANPKPSKGLAIGFVAAGGTLGLIAGGSVLLQRDAATRYNRCILASDASCNGGAAKRYTALAIGTAAGSVTALAIGIALLVRGPANEKTRESAMCLPAVAPQSGGLQCAFTF